MTTLDEPDLDRDSTTGGARRRWNARVAAGLFAVAFFALVGYALSVPHPYALIAAGVLFCIGGILTAFAIVGIRLGPDSKLRQALIDHPGMHPEERTQSREERASDGDRT